MYCPYCGKQIPENSGFCGYCGKKINENIKNKATEQEESKNKETEQDEKKVIKISLKMLIIIICVIIALMAIIMFTASKIFKVPGESIGNNVEQEKINNDSVQENNDNDFYKYLLNENWLKENLYLKTDYFGENIDTSKTQIVKFTQVTDSIGFAITELEEPYTRKCSILTYDRGSIKVDSLEEETSRDSYIVDKEKKILYKYHQNKGSISYDIYSIKDKEIKKICYISCYENGADEEGNIIYGGFMKNENEITEEEYNKIKNQYINKSIEEDDVFEIVETETLKKEKEAKIIGDKALRATIEEMESAYELKYYFGKGFDDLSSYTLLMTRNNYNLYKMIISYNPLAWGKNSETYIDTTKIEKTTKYVVYNIETGEIDICNNFNAAESVLYNK